MCNEPEPDYYRVVKEIGDVWQILDAEHHAVCPPFMHAEHAIDLASSLNCGRRMRKWERPSNVREQPAVAPCRDLGTGM